MDIKKIGIFGLGAVGSYVLYGLQDKKEPEICVIAKGARKEKLEQQGIFINGTLFHPWVEEPGQTKDIDLLIVATKYQGLLDSIDEIASCIGEHTLVLSLMNGVNSEEILGNRIGKDRVIYSMIRINSVHNPDGITFNAENVPGIFIGEKDTAEITPRIQAVLDAFAGSGVKITAVPDILTRIWNKYTYNICVNLPQAVIGCGVGAFLDSVHMQNLYRNLLTEVRGIAAAKGIIVTTSEEPSIIGKKSAVFSTLQDIRAGRKTEIDMFAGIVVQMGQELGIPTPYNQFLLDTIKALEEKNDGLFDY